MAVFKIELLAILLCLSSMVLGQRTPIITHISQGQFRDVGGQVDLDCSVQYAQDYPVLWVRYDHVTNQSLPLSTGSALIVRDSRYSLRFNPDSSTNRNAGTFTFTIKDVQESDAGLYQCQVIISVTNKITKEVQLQIRRPPIISDNATKSLVAGEGAEEPSTLRGTLPIEERKVAAEEKAAEAITVIASTLTAIQATLARIEEKMGPHN